jgi:hypothetical protein
MTGPKALLAGCTWAALVAGATLEPRSRAVQALVAAAMLVALGWTGARLARRLLPEEGLLTRALCAASAAVALATGLATALGHLGALRPGLFLLLVAVAFAAGLLLPMPAPRGERPVGGNPVDDPSPAPLRLRLERGLLLAAALALGGALALETARAAGEPRGLYGPDDLSYHLPAVAVWQRFGDLRMLKFAVGDRSTAFYPIAPELGAWALLAPFRDSDAAARRAQLPFALLSLAALAALARRLGLTPRGAALAVLCYLTFERAYPVLALTAGSDHQAAFFTLAALDGALLLLQRPSRGAAVYWGLGLGLLVASKYLGLYLAATVVALFLCGLALRRFRAQRIAADGTATGAGGLGGRLAIVAAVALLAGGYTYLRNAWTMGNPVFPAPVRLFGHTLLPGWKEATLAWRRHLPEFRIAPLGFLLRRPDLFGPLFPYTVLAGSLLAPPFLLLRRRPLLHVAVALLPAVLFLEFLFLVHDHRETRYLFAALALGALDLAWLLDDGEIAWVAALLVALFHLGCQRLGLGRWQEVALLLAVLGSALLGSRRRAPSAPIRLPAGRWAPWAAALLAVGALSLAARAMGEALARYPERKLAREPAALALERAAGPAGARVAYLGSNQPYLFFGSRLQNEVEIVPRTWNLAAQYYTWGGDGRFPYDDGSPRRWRRILEALKIDCVVAIRDPEEGPERGWILADPRGYQRIYDDGETSIWRVVR